MIHTPRISPLLLLLWMGLATSAVHSVSAQVTCPIVTDINKVPEARSSGIKPSFYRGANLPKQDERFVQVGTKFYFTADHPIHGRELWVTDATSTGTRMVLDLNPGPDDANPTRLAAANFAAGPRLVFVATDGTRGSELYSTDGTAAGTIQLAVLPSPGGLGNFTQLGNQMLLGWDEPWITDGTPNGTRRLKDIKPGPETSRPRSLVSNATNTIAFFAADDGQHGVELWRTDGTAAGTIMVTDLQSGTTGSNPSGLIFHNGVVFFSASGASRGLWRSDGTAAGTILLRSLSFELYGEAIVGNRLYFTGYDANLGNEVMETDGTPAGTKVAVDLVAGRGGSFPRSLYSDGTQLFFVARQDTSRGYEPFALRNGVATAIRPSATLTNVDRFLSIGGGITVFRGTDPQNGAELWRTDGTPANTRLVADIHAGVESSSPGCISSPAGGGLALFAARDAAHGEELWITNGTAASTTLVKDLYPSVGTADGLGRTRPSVVAGDRLFFQADDGRNGLEPHVREPDGTIHALGDLRPGPTGSDAADFTSFFNGREEVILFRADDGTHGVELWRTDGTAAGTRLLLDIYQGSRDSFPAYFTVADGIAYFTARTAAHGTELWRTDGTAAGTRRLTDLSRGTSSSIFRMVSFQGRIVFSAWDGSTRRLYTTDGTTAGTVPFGTTVFNSMGAMAASDTQIFLLASTGTSGTEPHSVDPNGQVRLIRDIYPGRLSSSFILYGVSNGRAFIRVRNSSNQLGVWATDGTAAGTVQIAIDERFVWCGRDRAYFTTFRTAGFFSSDGTNAGTLQVDTTAAAVAPVGTGCYYAVTDRERVFLRYTNGTNAGGTVCTVRANDNRAFVQPWWLLVVGNDLLFDGVHPRLGRELHRLQTFAVAHRSPIGGSCGSTRSTLRAGVPRLGSNLQLTVDRAPAGAGLLFAGLPAKPYALPGSFPCGLYLGLNGAVTVGASNASNWTVQVPIPRQTSLNGGLVNAQAVFLVPTGRFAETSNAVQLQIGQ